MNTYRVRWEIDVDADSHEEAARKAQASQIRPGTTATYFYVAEERQDARGMERHGPYQEIELGPIAPLSPEVQALIAAANKVETWLTAPCTKEQAIREMQYTLRAALAPFSESSPQPLTPPKKRKQKFKPNVRYEVLSPTGAIIVGTSEIVPGTAHGDVFFRNGEIGIEFGGETDLCWDAQETATKDGESIYVDNNGDEWKESELKRGKPISAAPVE